MPLPRMAVATALVASLATELCAGEAPPVWRIRVDGAVPVSAVPNDIDTASFSVGRDIYQWRNWKVGVRAGALTASGRSSFDGGTTYDNADANGVFVAPYFRHSVPVSWKSVKPFAEFGTGPLLLNRDFPYRPGTAVNRFEFRSEVRAGFDIRTSPTTSLELSGFWVHISNAQGISVNNINYDGFGLSIGYAFGG